MPPYLMLHQQRIFLMFGIGVLVTLAIVLARGSRFISFPNRKETEAAPHEIKEFGGGVTERQGPVPWLIWVVLGAFFLWAAVYVVYASRHDI
jgi:hypothetical protein